MRMVYTRLWVTLLCGKYGFSWAYGLCFLSPGRVAGLSFRCSFNDCMRSCVGTPFTYTQRACSEDSHPDAGFGLRESEYGRIVVYCFSYIQKGVLCAVQSARSYALSTSGSGMAWTGLYYFFAFLKVKNCVQIALHTFLWCDDGCREACFFL